MKEEDIRPARLKQISDRLFIQDAKRLLSHKAQFIDVACPACAQTNQKIYFVKKGYIFRLCHNCLTIYISPRPTAELLDHYYSTAKYYRYWMKHIFPISRQARIKNIYKPRVQLLQKYLEEFRISTKTLVDIGAGSGDFGEEISKQKLFSQIILVEPGEIQVKYLPALKVINKVFEEASLPKDINVFTCFETLEHLFSPVDFLNLVYTKLSKNGLLMFSTVNHQGFDILLLGNKSEYLIGPDHLNIFTADSIKLLLNRVGFKNIEVTTPGQLDVDLIVTAHKNGLIDLKKHPFLYHILVENREKYGKHFQKYLQEQKLSSHMLVVAQK